MARSLRAKYKELLRLRAEVQALTKTEAADRHGGTVIALFGASARRRRHDARRLHRASMVAPQLSRVAR